MRYLVLIASDPAVWERATAAQRQAWFDAHDAAIAACTELPGSHTVEIRPEVDIEGYEPPRDV